MTDTFFGDFDVEDALDTEPADPVQVARRLHRYRVLLERLAGRELADFDALPLGERNGLIGTGQRIVGWVHLHQRDDEQFARAIHGSGFDSLPEDVKRLAIAIAALIAAWLIRQGAWR